MAQPPQGYGPPPGAPPAGGGWQGTDWRQQPPPHSPYAVIPPHQGHVGYHGYHHGQQPHLAQLHGYHQALQQAPAARPPEPEALIKAPAPVGPHWPIDPRILESLPTLPCLAVESKPPDAAVLLSIESNAAHVLQEAATLHAQDKEAERLRKRANTIALIFLIIGFLGLVIFVGVVFLVIAGVAYWRGTRHGKLDLEDRRLEVVTGTLWTFAAELKPNRPVKMLADFTGYERQTPVRREKTGTGLFEQTRQLILWHHHWLLARMTLADGVAVMLDVTTRVKRKTLQKRKYEKKKDVVVEQLTIRLTPPKGKAFPGHQQLPAMQLPGLVLRRGLIQPRHATFVYQTAPAQRVCTRSGWAAYQLENQLDSRKVVAALIHSYKSAARVKRGASHAG